MSADGRRPGYFTKRLADDWLRDVIDQARRGTLPGMVRTGASFAGAAAEWLRYIEHDRGRKPSTLQGYRSTLNAHLLPAFGSMAIEDVTTEEIERWIAGFGGSIRMRNKLVIQLHGILARAKKVYGLSANAATEVEKFPQRRTGDIDVFSPEEVWALVRAATNAQDAAICLTAAFTGLRMGELLALCWRGVDFTGSVIRVRASYYLGSLTTPKSGKVRAVPMAPTSPRRSRKSASDRIGWATTTSCSSARPVATSTVRHCVAATSRRSPPRVCVLCAFTTFATPSGRA